MKSLRTALNLIKHKEFTTKIQIFMSQITYGEDYDEYENNVVRTNLNPITIKGYVHDISPEALVWKQYGLQNIGAKEILCDDKYKNLFEFCNKIVIDGNTYQVFRESASNKATISVRPYHLLRVVVTRKD